MKTEGLTETLRDLGKFDKELRKRVTGRIRELLRVVRDEARREAAEQGFGKPGRSGRGTGELVKDIKISVTNRGGMLRETAVNAHGYSYPRIYEFRKLHGRPFLYPAAEKEAPHIEEAIERLAGDLIAEVF